MIFCLATTGTKSDSALCKNHSPETDDSPQQQQQQLETVTAAEQRKKKMYFLYKNRTFVEKKLCRRPTAERFGDAAATAVPVTRLPPILNQYLNQSPTSKRKSEFRHNDSSSLDMYPSDQSVQSKRSASSSGHADVAASNSDDETGSSDDGDSDDDDDDDGGEDESTSDAKPAVAAAPSGSNARPVRSAVPRMSGTAPVVTDQLQQENQFRPATSRAKTKGGASGSKDRNKEQGLMACACRDKFKLAYLRFSFVNILSQE